MYNNGSLTMHAGSVSRDNNGTAARLSYITLPLLYPYPYPYT